MDRSIAPAIQQNVSINKLPVEKKVFDNGVEVNYINGGSQEILKIELVFEAGSKFQDKPLQAALGFDWIKEGTKRLSGNEFTEAIDVLGAYLSSETTKDFGTFTVFVLNKFLKQTLDLLAEMLTSPRWGETDFERLVEYQKNTFLINEEKTNFLAKQRFSERLFNGTVYGRVAVKESFDAISSDDVRGFMETNVLGTPFEVLVSGMIGKNEKEVIDEFASSIQISSNENSFELGEVLSLKGEHHIDKDSEQCSVYLGKLMPNKDQKDTHKISILNTILGGYFGSRLMQNIREAKGWTYGISSGILSYKDAASLVISSDVLKDKKEDTLTEIKHEFDKLSNELISEKELGLVKNYLKGRVLKSFDGPFEQADRYFTINTFGLDWSFFDDYIETLETITAEELQDVAKKYFQFDDLTIISAGGE